MTDMPGTDNILKELAKEPLLLVMAVIIGAGAYLLKGSDINATWFVGLGMIGIGVVTFLVRLISSFFDSSFKRNYTTVIETQDNAIKTQAKLIKEYGKNAVAVSKNITSPETLSGGYKKTEDTSTTLSTTSTEI